MAHIHGDCGRTTRPREERLPTATGAVTSHTVDTSMSGTPATTGVVTAATGGGGAHNNPQPYIVAYRWKRTA